MKRMLDALLLVSFLESVSKDERTTVWHVAILLAIAHSIIREKVNPVPICRRQVMLLSCINSIATYHKCIRQLVEFGYITYVPSYHPGIRTMVKLVM